MLNNPQKHITHLILCLAFLFSLVTTSSAQETARRQLTALGMFTNDTFWDGSDRWRTGSYQRSFLFKSGQYELRFRSEYLAPQNLVYPDTAHDRPYASVVQMAAYYHHYRGDMAYSLGVSMDFINQIKAMESFHKWIHAQTGFGGFDLQKHYLESATKWGAQAAWRKDMRTRFGYAIPFMEAEYGSRKRLTAGMDLLFTQRDYLFYTREQTTGHLLGDSVVTNEPYYQPSIDWVIGGDVTRVYGDYFLDGKGSNVTREDMRYRLRLGARLHFPTTTLFIGPTYLSKEFKEQKEGQILQTISLEFRF